MYIYIYSFFLFGCTSTRIVFMLFVVLWCVIHHGLRGSKMSIITWVNTSFSHGHDDGRDREEVLLR